MKLIHTKISIGFNPATGKEIFGNKWKCPNFRWFQFALHDNYDDFTKGIGG